MKSSSRRKPANVAVVTGAGVRLGRAIALALHREGYAVAVHFHSSRAAARGVVRAILSEGGRAVAVQADIRSARGANGAIASALKVFGRIDLLVNSAAVFRPNGVFTTTEKGWDEAIDTNLKGMFFCSQAAARAMRRRGGAIINIASVGGLQAWSGHIPYSVSKAGVIMLTKCLARALAPGIRVNAVAPGTIIVKGEETGIRHVPVGRIPLRKYGVPSDIAGMVVYLATRAGYVTGQVFAVDGGRSIT